jgi:hypothetical protein
LGNDKHLNRFRGHWITFSKRAGREPLSWLSPARHLQMILQAAAFASIKTHRRADTTAEPQAYKNTLAEQMLRLPPVSRKTIKMSPLLLQMCQPRLPTLQITRVTTMMMERTQLINCSRNTRVSRQTIRMILLCIFPLCFSRVSGKQSGRVLRVNSRCGWCVR